MPKQAFPAAAEGMPIFNRRTILGGVAGLTVTGAMATPAAVVAEVPNEHPARPPDTGRMIEIAFLLGSLPPPEREMALRAMQEIRDGRRRERS